MVSTMVLSILTPTYNRAESFLTPMVESVAQAIMSPNSVELLLVDDCSTDSTPTVIRNLQKQYPFVKYLHTTDHSGPAAARNLALSNASGEFVADIDDDDIVPFYALVERVRLLQESGKAWLHGNAFQINEQGVLLHKENLLCEKLEGQSENFVAFYESKNFAFSGTKVYRRSVLEEVGGWDKEFPYLAEDMALWLKLSHHAGDPAQTRLPLIFYRKKEDSLGINAVRSGEMEKAIAAIRQKYAKEYAFHQARLVQKQTES